MPSSDHLAEFTERWLPHATTAGLLRLVDLLERVSPLLILLALSFWGLVWGIVGMILAVPLLVSIKIVLENIKATRPLATLMSNI